MGYSNARTKRPGVYIILCLVNQKRYIGSSGNVNHRIPAHKAGLRYGNHHCSALLKDYQKYGKDAFLFWVEEYCKTKDEAVAIEERLLQSESDKSLLYNKHSILDPFVDGDPAGMSRQPEVLNCVVDIAQVLQMAKGKGVTPRELYKRAGYAYIHYWRHFVAKNDKRVEPGLDTMRTLLKVVESL